MGVSHFLFFDATNGNLNNQYTDTTPTDGFTYRGILVTDLGFLFGSTSSQASPDWRLIRIDSSTGQILSKITSGRGSSITVPVNSPLSSQLLIAGAIVDGSSDLQHSFCYFENSESTFDYQSCQVLNVNIGQVANERHTMIIGGTDPPNSNVRFMGVIEQQPPSNVVQFYRIKLSGNVLGGSISVITQVYMTYTAPSSTISTPKDLYYDTTSNNQFWMLLENYDTGTQISQLYFVIGTCQQSGTSFDSIKPLLTFGGVAQTSNIVSQIYVSPTSQDGWFVGGASIVNRGSSDQVSLSFKHGYVMKTDTGSNICGRFNSFAGSVSNSNLPEYVPNPSIYNPTITTTTVALTTTSKSISTVTTSSFTQLCQTFPTTLTPQQATASLVYTIGVSPTNMDQTVNFVVADNGCTDAVIQYSFTISPTPNTPLSTLSTSGFTSNGQAGSGYVRISTSNYLNVNTYVITVTAKVQQIPSVTQTFVLNVQILPNPCPSDTVLTPSTPSGTHTWIAGSPHTITWTTPTQSSVSQPAPFVPTCSIVYTLKKTSGFSFLEASGEVITGDPNPQVDWTTISTTYVGSTFNLKIVNKIPWGPSFDQPFSLTILDPCPTANLSTPQSSTLTPVYYLTDPTQMYTISPFNSNFLVYCGPFTYNASYDPSIFSFNPSTLLVSLYSIDEAKAGNQSIIVTGHQGAYTINPYSATFTVQVILNCSHNIVNPPSYEVKYYQVKSVQVNHLLQDFISVLPSCQSAFSYTCISASTPCDSNTFSNFNKGTSVYTIEAAMTGTYLLTIKAQYQTISSQQSILLYILPPPPPVSVPINTAAPVFDTLPLNIATQVGALSFYSFPTMSDIDMNSIKITSSLGDANAFIQFDSRTNQLIVNPFKQSQTGVFTVTVTLTDITKISKSSTYKINVIVFGQSGASLSECSSKQKDRFQAQIQNITTEGVLNIKFSKEVSIPQNFTFINGSIIDISITPSRQYPDRNLNFTWNLTDFQPWGLRIQLFFDRPTDISYKVTDRLNFTILQMAFFVTKSSTLPSCTFPSISYPIPKQLQSNGTIIFLFKLPRITFDECNELSFNRNESFHYFQSGSEHCFVSLDDQLLDLRLCSCFGV